MKTRLLSGMLFAAFLVVATRWAAADGKAGLAMAPGARLLKVSAENGFYTEPGLAINPRNPKQVVVVYQGGAGVQGGATVAYSNDSGNTFTVAEGTGLKDWRVAGDVTTAFDNKGNAYLSYLTFDRLGTTSYWAQNAGRNGIYVRRSPDGGKSWSESPVPVKAFLTGKEKPLHFEDEPRIFADTEAKSRYAGSLYVGWVEWQLEKSIMLFSRSVDQGKSWSTALEISTHPGLPRDDNGGLGGYMQAVNADGTIYAIWIDASTIVMADSSDGGRHFGKPRQILETGPPYFGVVPGVSRVAGFPQVAIDSRPGKGTLYVTWSDYTNGDVDVFLASSSDGGHKWSKPVRVNSDPVHDGKDQFYQSLAVDAVNGDVYVQFYDRRAGDKTTGFTLARSSDAGRTFQNYVWALSEFDSRGAFLGDYTWMAAHGGRVLGAWTETVSDASPVKSAAGTRPHPPRTLIRVGTATFDSLHAR